MVEAEGEPIYNNTAFLIDFRTGNGEKEFNVTLDLPTAAVPGKEGGEERLG